jgi:threonine synthase
MAPQQLQRRLKAPAARADQRNLVDDNRREIDSYQPMDRGLHDHCATRLSHLYSLHQTQRRAGCIHYPIIGRLGRLLFEPRVDAKIGCNPQLLLMMPVLVNLRAVSFQNLTDQQAELSISDDSHWRAGGNSDLIENLAGRGERFDENRMFGGDLARYAMQIAHRQRQEFAKSAGMFYDPEHSALGTMTPQPSLAPLAGSASQIDLTHHALADPIAIVRCDHFADELVPRRSAEAVVTVLKLDIGIADSAAEQPDQSESFGPPRARVVAQEDHAFVETNREHIVDTLIMLAELACFEQKCGARFPITDAIYNCTHCGSLLEVRLLGDVADTAALQRCWRTSRTLNDPVSQSGVWRYHELLPFDGEIHRAVTLREGNTPLLDAPRAAQYGGLDHLTFKHQGFNPTGSFKDNGMTCGVTQAIRLGKKRVACVSTGNTSASMAAYASAAGLDSIVFIPHGNISYGKLAQALEYGARTLQVEANFDQILALVRVLAERLGIYLLNSINPFRIEGQKTIIFEMLDQRDWNPPDWIVLPGGNLGNTSAFGKALRELRSFGFITKMPRLAVIQAEGAAPFYDFMKTRGEFSSVKDPHTLATAIKIGDPVSWPKAFQEVEDSKGLVEKVSEQEIADAKAIIGRCGIGCEPASAATLAGIRKLTRSGAIRESDDVIAVLTGNVLKDPDYIYRYHTGQLKDPEGRNIDSRFGNKPIVAPNDADAIARILEG